MFNEGLQVSNDHIKTRHVKIANLSAPARDSFGPVDVAKRAVLKVEPIRLFLPFHDIVEVCGICVVGRVVNERSSRQDTLRIRINDYHAGYRWGGSPAPVQFGLTMAFLR